MKSGRLTFFPNIPIACLKEKRVSVYVMSKQLSHLLISDIRENKGRWGKKRGGPYVLEKDLVPGKLDGFRK